MKFGITREQIEVLLAHAQVESEVWHVATRALHIPDCVQEWFRCARLLNHSTPEELAAALKDQR